MKKDNLNAILIELAENATPTSQIDLWPALKDRLKTSQWHPIKGDLIMKQTIFHRALLAALMLAITFVILLTTPQGRAFAQNILQFFTRSKSDTLLMPTAEPLKWVNLTPVVPTATVTPLPTSATFAGDCGDLSTPTCTVEQARSKVDFTIKEPANLSAGLYFVGATDEQDGVWLRYESEGHSGGMTVIESLWTGKPLSPSPEIGANAIVEKVQIGVLAGEYVKGSFVTTDTNPVAVWDENAGIEALRWVDGNVFYSIQYYSSTLLGKEGLVALAESMTTQPVIKLPMPVSTEVAVWNPRDTYNLDVPSAEQKAGFKLQLPAKLLEILSLIGAVYEPEHKIVKVFFLLDQTLWGPNTDGLVLSQQLAPKPSDNVLGDIVIGNYNTLKEDAGYRVVVSADANVETVQIGNVTGKYVEGVWSGTDCCGWVWESQPYIKTLRWWVDGRSFELFYMGTALEKADMIKVAESLK